MTQFLTHIKENSAIIFLMITGFALRLAGASRHSYSSDELSAINRLNYPSMDQMIEHGVKHGDFHPAGVQVFERFWTSWLGNQEVVLRFPFIMCGVLSIFLIYWIGKKYVSKHAGIIAGTLLTVTYFPIIHSELARPYSPGLLFILMSSWFILKFILADFPTDKAKYINTLALGISLALVMYTHYFAFMLVGFMGITGLFFTKKKNLLAYILSGYLAFILFAPHLGITLHHLSIEGGLGWLGRPGYGWLIDFLYFAFNDSLWLTATLLLAGIIAVFSSKYAPPTKESRNVSWVLGIWFFGIYVLAFVFSYVSSPILKFPVMLFPLPFFFLLLGRLFSRVSPRVLFVLTSVIFTTGIASTLFEKDLLGNNHFGLLKELAEPMVEWRKKLGEENIITLMNVNNPNYLNYYAIPLGDSLTFDKDVIEFDEDKTIREKLLTEERPYCIVGYSTRPTSPHILETCLEFYPNIIANHQYQNSAVLLLTKNPSIHTKIISKQALATFQYQQSNEDWNYNPKYLKEEFYLLDSINKYGPSFTFQLVDLKTHPRALKKHYFKVSLAGQAHFQSELSATVTAERNGKPVTDNYGDVIWLGKDLEEMLLKPQGNQKGYFAFRIPSNIKQHDVIKISFWNRNGKPVKIREIKLELVEDLF